MSIQHKFIAVVYDKEYERGVLACFNGLPIRYTAPEYCSANGYSFIATVPSGSNLGFKKDNETIKALKVLAKRLQELRVYKDAAYISYGELGSVCEQKLDPDNIQ